MIIGIGVLLGILLAAGVYVKIKEKRAEKELQAAAKQANKDILEAQAIEDAQLAATLAEVSAAEQALTKASTDVAKFDAEIDQINAELAALD